MSNQCEGRATTAEQAGISRSSARLAGISRRTVMATVGGSIILGATGARAQGQAPKRGGTLTATLTPEPPILVLGIGSQAPTLIAASKLYQGLLRYSPKLDPEPELAKAWDVSADAKVYTFRLQENVKFHDGRPMTADDVIFSITQFHMKVSPRARNVFAKIVKAEAPDPLTVRLTLDTPFEPFLLMFDVTTCAIVPKHIYDGTDYATNPANQKPVGTGPFQFSEWQRGNFIRFKRFDGYWKPGQPYLDEIVYRIVPDSQSRAAAVQNGQVELCQGSDIEPFDIPRLRKVATLEVTTKGYEYYGPMLWVDLNNRIKPLDDARVRRAICMALDRDFVVNRLWFGVGRMATGPFASSTRYYNPKARIPFFDLKGANQLLDEAGLKPNADGVRFTMKHLVMPYGEMWLRLSEYIRTALKKVGIEVVLENTDAAGWGQRVSNWDYETTVNVVYQYGDPTLGVERTYVSSNIQKVIFANTAGYSNPEVDALFATARNAADSDTRREAFAKVQEILVRDMPLVWLSEVSFATVYNKRVHNVVSSGTGVQASFDNVFLA